ncbi:methyltransferase domain-containing protein [Ornithinibacillus xuwenensis]|uniref:Methyltransferase domain-containing protein n=1 Tax=Ornithinibacillus xuwenensis TaxID=3144668 RepID=A0ABU9XHV8_9BACI
MERIMNIRKEEKAYHDYCYDNYKLFAAGSWLHKPVQTVLDQLPYFTSYETLRVLDLGSGVGRNSIPIANMILEKDMKGEVVCVDMLDSAIAKLTCYSSEFGLTSIIKVEKSTIESFNIGRNTYDLIVAVSSLEHVESEAVLQNKLTEMIEGTKKGGINCLIVNSSLEEVDMETGDRLEVNTEINLKTEEMNTILLRLFTNWTVLKHMVKPLEYQITRNGRKIALKTNAITFVVRK